jgi:hypothetical protein
MPEQFELGSTREKNREFKQGKPFDLLAGGPCVPSSRSERTPLELFISGVRGWEAELCRHIVGLSDGKRP